MKYRLRRFKLWHKQARSCCSARKDFRTAQFPMADHALGERPKISQFQVSKHSTGKNNDFYQYHSKACNRLGYDYISIWANAEHCQNFRF